MRLGLWSIFLFQKMENQEVSLGEWLLQNKYFLIGVLIGIIALIFLRKNMNINQ